MMKACAKWGAWGASVRDRRSGAGNMKEVFGKRSDGGEK